MGQRKQSLSSEATSRISLVKIRFAHLCQLIAYNSKEGKILFAEFIIPII